MGSNRNTIIGFLLIFGILIAYYFYMQPSQEEIAEQQRRHDSIARVQYVQDSIQYELQRAQAKLLEDQKRQIENITEIVEDSDVDEQQIILKDKYGLLAGSASGEDEMYYIETDLQIIGISAKGGRIKYVQLKEYQTWDSLPLVLMDSDTSVFGLHFFSDNRIINTSDFYFQPIWYGAGSGDHEIKISGEDEVKFGMRLYTDNPESGFNENQYIEFIYTVRANDYMLDFDVDFKGTRDLVDATRGYIDLEWKADLRQQERSVDRFNGSTVYYKIIEDKVDYLSETKDDNEKLKDKLKWASFKQVFFSSTLIADNSFIDPEMSVAINETSASDRYLKTTAVKLGIPYQPLDDQSIGMSFYFGPNQYNIMTSYGLDLERQIPLGWSFFLMQWINRFIVLPVFNYLGSFGWNYGIVILVLTILLKTVLFPIAYKTYMSSARMRVLKPEVDELGKKFPKKEDAMKKQQATMALYKKAGVNPMAGCVPVLLQFPILIALFRFFPASIELRQQSFLWATDLSTYDSILSLPFEIPFYGDHVSLFTLLMTISTLIYTYLNNQMMMTGSQQMPGMKTMMYIMPIMFLGIFNNYASGLSYYYFLVNVITFMQMFIFRWVVNEEKIKNRIEQNKLKPQKAKSAFQKRLEDAAKQRGYDPKKKK